MKKEKKCIEKIIQISGDWKQIWALTNKGNIYKKEYLCGECNIGWTNWIKIESIN